MNVAATSDTSDASSAAEPTPAAPPTRSRLRLALAFAGPAFLVAVGYVDPGNWGADLAGGSRFGARLLWILVGANVIALFLQYLSAKLGLATGDHLASLLGRRLPPAQRMVAAVLVEGAMVATETAEFLGVMVGIRLLTGLPLLVAAALGFLAIVVLVVVTSSHHRRLEMVIFGLLAVISIVYVVELWLAPPGLSVATGLVPRLPPGSILVAVAMLGATVMPHNLFLHSGLILSRAEPGVPRRTVLRKATWETGLALNLALIVNAAIVLLAASTFGRHHVTVESLGQAHRTLQPLLGRAAATFFAVGLLAAGLASTVTGGLAGQLVIDGLLRVRLPVILRRLVSMVPAVIILAAGVGEIEALVWSQAVLCLILPATAWAVVALTSDGHLMGPFVNRRVTRMAGRLLIAALFVLNGALVVSLLL